MKRDRLYPVLAVTAMIAAFAFLTWFFQKSTDSSGRALRSGAGFSSAQEKATPSSPRKPASGSLTGISARAMRSPAGTSARKPTTAREPYRGAMLLQQEDGPVGAGGSFVRRRLLRTEKKYPLIRVDETMEADGSGGWRVASRMAWVADHVLVRLEAGYSRKDLLRAARSHGGEILKDVAPGYYLVSFEGAELRALERFSEGFRRESAVRIVEPDYLVQASR